jgi:hypothetical protein
MLTIVCLLWLAAFIGTLISAYGKCPLWVPVLLVTIAGLIGCIPLR